MPGYLPSAQMQQARTTPPDQFDNLFIQLMTAHHAGAVRMADEEWHGSGDPRLLVIAHAIRHEQQGEIALMHGAERLGAVATATRKMFADHFN